MRTVLMKKENINVCKVMNLYMFSSLETGKAMLGRTLPSAVTAFSLLCVRENFENSDFLL